MMEESIMDEYVHICKEFNVPEKRLGVINYPPFEDSVIYGFVEDTISSTCVGHVYKIVSKSCTREGIQIFHTEYMTNELICHLAITCEDPAFEAVCIFLWQQSNYFIKDNQICCIEQCITE